VSHDPKYYLCASSLRVLKTKKEVGLLHGIQCDIRKCVSPALKLGKSKAVPRHGGAWGGEEYSSYSLLTSALDGVSGQRHAPAALCPGKRPPVPIGQEAGWAPEPVWTQRSEENSFAPAGDRTPIVQSIVRHYTT
jgi:hypothetical protein